MASDWKTKFPVATRCSNDIFLSVNTFTGISVSILSLLEVFTSFGTASLE
jgi:hypothetical protein